MNNSFLWTSRSTGDLYQAYELGPMVTPGCLRCEGTNSKVFALASRCEPGLGSFEPAGYPLIGLESVLLIIARDIE